MTAPDIAALVARLRKAIADGGKVSTGVDDHALYCQNMYNLAVEAAVALEAMQAAIKRMDEAGQEAHQAYKDAAARAERAEASLRKANAALELAGAGIIGPNDGELAKSLAEQLVRAEAERDALRAELEQYRIMHTPMGPKDYATWDEYHRAAAARAKEGRDD